MRSDQVLFMAGTLRNTVMVCQRHSVTGIRSDNGMTTGERIRAEREAQGVSRAELAKAAGIAVSTLSDLELGLSKGTTALHKIAARLGVRAEWFETGRGQKSSAHGVSQPLTLDAGKLATSIKFLEDLFRVHGKAFEPAGQSKLIAAVYAELLETSEPNWVELTNRYGKGLDDERQRAAAGVGTDDSVGTGQRAAKAAVAAGRKR